jgi:hypothetical protein
MYQKPSTKMRIILKSLLLVFTTYVGFSQKSYVPKIYLGIRSGINGSAVSSFALPSQLTPTFRLLPAFTGSVFAEFELNERFSIQPELMFSQKGFRIKENIDLGDDFLGINLPISGKLSLRTNYIEAPVLAKIKVGNNKDAHGYFVIGPNLGYLADVDLLVRFFSILPFRSDVSTSFFKSFEFSGIGGFGYEIPIGQKGSKIFMEGRYQHGFTRILDTPIVQLPVRNRTISFGAGVIFALNQK